MSKKKKDEGFNPSWPLVVLGFIGPWWPLGLYMLWCKIKHSDSSDFEKDAKRIDRGSTVLIVLGLLALFGSSGAEVAALAAFMGLGGVSLRLYNRMLKRRNKRFQRYAAFIGSQEVVSIKDIAEATGTDYNTVLRDLRIMLDEDELLPTTAYIDERKGIYVRSSAFAPKVEQKAAAQSSPKPSKPRVQQEAPKPVQTSFGQAPHSDYLDKLREIRKVNDAIQNEKVSAQIERIEQITGNIFEIITEHPEKKNMVATFMNYYLPTTLKLLTTYATLEKQGVHGDNIESSKRNIEKLLDQLVWAFEHQNDQLFEGDALDINSDVKVMETMMARDGFSDGPLPHNPFARKDKAQEGGQVQGGH